MNSLSKFLYKAAGLVRMGEVVGSGNPKKIARYAKNRIINKAIWSIIRGLKK